MKKYYLFAMVIVFVELCGSGKSGGQKSEQVKKSSAKNSLQRSSTQVNDFKIATALDTTTKKVMQSMVTRPDGTTRAAKYNPVTDSTLHLEFDVTGQQTGQQVVPGGLDLSSDAMAKIAPVKSIKVSKEGEFKPRDMESENAQKNIKLSDQQYEDGSKLSRNINGEQIITLPDGSWLEYVESQGLVTEIRYHSNKFDTTIEEYQIPIQFQQSQAMQTLKNLPGKVAIDAPKKGDQVMLHDQQIETVAPVSMTHRVKNSITKDEFINYSDGTREVKYHDGSVKIDFGNKNRFEYTTDGIINIYNAQEKSMRTLYVTGYAKEARLIKSERDVVNFMDKIAKDADLQIAQDSRKILVKKSRTWFPLFNSLAFKEWIIDSIRSMLHFNLPLNKITHEAISPLHLNLQMQ